MPQSQRIGILGGTFDPVHDAHLALAMRACEAFDLDQVLFVPCAQQALKSNHPVASAADRLAMLRLAIEGNPKFALETLEVEQGGTTYTVDTLRTLTQRNPDVKYFFIMGMDSVVSFPRWRDPDVILDLCEIIAFDRPGYAVPEHLYSPKLLAHYLPLALDTSATSLRKNLAKDPMTQYPIPLLVQTYIRQHNLYR